MYGQFNLGCASGQMIFHQVDGYTAWPHMITSPVFFLRSSLQNLSHDESGSLLWPEGRESSPIIADHPPHKLSGRHLVIASAEW